MEWSLEPFFFVASFAAGFLVVLALGIWVSGLLAAAPEAVASYRRTKKEDGLPFALWTLSCQLLEHWLVAGDRFSRTRTASLCERRVQAASSR